MSNAEVSYGRRLVEIAAERPDDADLLLVDREGTEVPVTWRELEVRSNQIAQVLDDLGVAPDSVVALGAAVLRGARVRHARRVEARRGPAPPAPRPPRMGDGTAAGNRLTGGPRQRRPSRRRARAHTRRPCANRRPRTARARRPDRREHPHPGVVRLDRSPEAHHHPGPGRPGGRRAEHARQGGPRRGHRARHLSPVPRERLRVHGAGAARRRRASSS